MGQQKKENIIDIILAISIGIMAVIAFAIQVALLDEKTTARETVLFNILQFTLVAGFSWFGTRAISKGEFEKSLKRFAVGAYRRITDINSIVKRLKKQVDSILINDIDGKKPEINTISAIVEDTSQVIQSSIADWSDVIGDEIMTIENIKNLEKEKAIISHDELTHELNRKYEKELEKINDKINELRMKLPPKLQISSDFIESPMDVPKAVRWLERAYIPDVGTTLEVRTGSVYGNRELAEQIKAGEELSVLFQAGGGIDVLNKDGIIVGRLLNTTPVSYGSFQEGIIEFYDTGILKLIFERFNPAKEGDTMSYFVRILNKPAKGKEQ